jgi:hypothetical protein
MLSVTRTSVLSGTVRTLELPITQEDLDRYERGEGLIQQIFPNLTADQREFIKTGITKEEWDDLFKDRPE